MDNTCSYITSYSCTVRRCWWLSLPVQMSVNRAGSRILQAVANQLEGWPRVENLLGNVLRSVFASQSKHIAGVGEGPYRSGEKVQSSKTQHS